MIVGTAELNVVANAATFEPSLRAQTAGGLAAVGRDAGKAGKDVEEGLAGGAARGVEGVEKSGGKLGGVLGGFGAMFAGFGATAGKETEGIGKKLEGLAEPFGGLGLVATAGFGAAVAGMVEMGAKFQPITASIASAEGISTRAADNIGKAFLATSGQSTFSGQQMAAAFAPVAGVLTQLQGHALSAAQAVHFEAAAADLAESKHMDLSTATGDLVKVMQAYGMQAGQAGAATNDLYNTSRITGVGVDTISMSLGRLHSQLGSATPALGDASALLVDLTEHGETGRQAMGALSTAFLGIVNPSAAVTAEQKKMGVSFIDTKTGALLPMRDIIGELAPKLAGMGNAQAAATLQSLGFGQASLKLASTIEAGVPAYAAAQASVGKVGAAHEAAERQANTFEGRMKTAKAAVSNLGTGIGTDLLPVFSKIATTLATGLVPLLAKLGDFIQHNTGWLLPLVGALLAAFAAFKIGTMVMAAFNAVMDANPWVLALTALAAIALVVATHWQVIWGAMRQAVEVAWNAIKTVISIVWTSAIRPVFDAVSTAVKAVGTVFDTVWHAIDAVFQFVAEHIIQIIKIGLIAALGPIGVAIDLLWTHWSAVWNAVKDVVNTVWNSVLKPVFAAIVAVGLAEIHAGIDLLKAAWNTAWTVVSGAVSTAWSVLKPVFSTIKTVGLDVITTAINVLKTTWDTVWGGLKATMDAMWKVVKPIFDAIKRVVDDLVGGLGKVVGAIGKVASIGGGLVGGAKNLIGKGLGLIPLAGGGTVGAGGMTTGPTVLVGEGNPAHPEYVIPTDPAHRSNARSLHAAVGARLMQAGGVIGAPVFTETTAAGMTPVDHQVLMGLSTLSMQLNALGFGFGSVVAAITDGATSTATNIGKSISTLDTDVVTQLKAVDTDNASAIATADADLQGALSSMASSIQGAIQSATSSSSSGGPGGGGPTLPGSGTATAGLGDTAVLAPTVPAAKSWNDVASVIGGVAYDNSTGRIAYFGPNAEPGSAAPFAGSTGSWTDPTGKQVYYDSGGWLPPGRTMVMNATGRPEPVLTHDQLAGMNRGNITLVFETHFDGVTDVEEIKEHLTGVATQGLVALRRELRAGARPGTP